MTEKPLVLTTSSQYLENKDLSEKVLVFKVLQEVYGIPIGQVNKVIGLQPYFAIPGSPPYVLGAIRLRGKIITLIHLKRRLALGNELPDSKDSCIICIKVNGDIVGILVDEVIGIHIITPDQVNNEVALSIAKIDKNYLTGVAIMDNKKVFFLNLDTIFSDYTVKETSPEHSRVQQTYQRKEQEKLS